MSGRFDDISRIVASDIPRREAVRLILGVLAGGALARHVIWPAAASALDAACPAAVTCTDATGVTAPAGAACPGSTTFRCDKVEQCCRTATGVNLCCCPKDTECCATPTTTRCCPTRAQCCADAAGAACCCPTGQVCILGGGVRKCCPSANVCGAAPNQECCTDLETCVAGRCCQTPFVCDGVCCATFGTECLKCEDGTKLCCGVGTKTKCVLCPTGSPLPRRCCDNDQICNKRGQCEKKTSFIPSIESGPPTRLVIVVSNNEAGLALIEVVNAINAAVVCDPFIVGTLNPVRCVATKLVEGVSASVTLRATSAEGGVTVGDPLLTAVLRHTGRPEGATFTDLPQAESRVTVVNGTPGLRSLRVSVNDRQFQLAGLKDGERVTLDVAPAMRPGDANTITLTPSGAPGGAATVLVSD